MLKVIEVALSQVGYLEKKSNADLDDFTKNAGYNNFTKYARDLDKLGDFYNTPKQGFAWCECFVDWCFVKAYGEAMALVLTCQPKKSAGAGCTQSAGYYKNKKRFYTSNPKVGDQIFFAWGGEVEHTGLVWKVDKSTVYTVEGNTNGKSGVVANGGGVFKKEYPIGSSSIYGYGRPDYGIIDTGDNEPSTPKEPENKNNILLPDVRKGDDGELVKTVQALLIKRWGISCGVYGMDGDFGSATYSAVVKFQKNNGLSQTGVVNTSTWKKLLGV